MSSDLRPRALTEKTRRSGGLVTLPQAWAPWALLQPHRLSVNKLV